MNALFTTKLARSLHTTILFALGVLPTPVALAQTGNTDPPYSVVDRGPFYRVLQRTVSVTDDATGQVSQQVQGYTELEDGLNYLSNGVWVTSQDLVEVTATGAQAVHGQMTGTFSSDITSVGAITLTTATESFQSHPIGLFYTDYASGKVAKIGSSLPLTVFLSSPSGPPQVSALIRTMLISPPGTVARTVYQDHLVHFRMAPIVHTSTSVPTITHGLLPTAITSILGGATAQEYGGIHDLMMTSSLPRSSPKPGVAGLSRHGYNGFNLKAPR